MSGKFKVGDKVILREGYEEGWQPVQLYNGALTVRDIRQPRHTWEQECLQFEELYEHNPTHWRHSHKYTLALLQQSACPKGDPALPVVSGSGVKLDAGKPQFELLANDCANAELGIVQVMTWAVQVKGYVPGSWQTVPEAIKRYGAALRRHQSAKARGERYDKESGLLHDFHIATNAVFVAELEARVDRAKGCAVFEYNKTLPKA